MSIAIAIVSTIVLLFVKTEEHKIKHNDENKEPEIGIFERINSKTKKILGTFLSVFAGLMYALTYEPQL